ncbi:MAG: ubiquinol-cytochrome c reductase iron-sulfur subunit [Dehalococcoidia bacterium]
MTEDARSRENNEPAPADAAPAAEAAAGPTDPSRRRLMTAVVGACAGAIGVAVGAPAAIMFIGPMLEDTPREWRPVGAVDQFTVGNTVSVTFETVAPVPWSGVTATVAAWLRRESETEFIAFAVNCTHLGCPVRWEQTASLFLCPCHGGTYYASGDVAAGPPPYALNRYPVRVTDGQVEIQTSPLPIR